MTREEILAKGFFDNSEKGDRRFLSNYHYQEITYCGLRVPTNEHAYQMMKATNPEDRKFVAFQPSPNKARLIGQSIPCREDWFDVRVQIMKDVNRLKFQNNELRAMLLATGDDELVEYNWWNDTFYGVNSEGVGQNMLGKILMEIREEIRKENL